MQSGQTKYGIGMTVSACLWLGLFPLLQFGTFSSLTRDKWIIMFILGGVTLAGFIADCFCRRVFRPRLLPLLLGGGLLLWVVLSCLLCPYPGSPWWIGTGRREGLATQLCYFGIFFLFSFSRVRRVPVIISSVCGVFVFLAVVLLQRAGGNPFGLYPGSYSYATAPRFQGTIGNVDMCAGYLLIAAGLFVPALVDCFGPVFRSFRGKHTAGAAVISVFFLAAALAACVYLFVTMEVRFGLLALALLAVWTLIRFLPARFRVPLLLLLMIIALVLVWCFPFTQLSTLHELHETLHGRAKADYGAERIGAWTYTLRMLRDEGHLLFGTGADTYAMRFSAYLQQYFKDHPEAEHLRYNYDNPHNEYLALLVNCGVPALLLFAALVIIGCFGGKPWRDSVLCYGIQAFFSFSVCIVAPMFWAVLGMSVSALPPKKSRSVLQKPEA